MRYGFATLLGEIINADICTYEDCKSFQIVCPECKEPLFKVHREKDGVHFFSHYRNDNEFHQDCEKRVLSYKSEAITLFNQKSRKQTLKIFISQFTEQLRSLNFYPGNRKKIIKIINKNYLFNLFIKDYFCAEWLKSIMHDAKLDGIKNRDVNNIENIKKITIQKRITIDMLDMLLTHKQRENLIELIAFSIYLAMPSIQNIESKYDNEIHQFQLIVKDCFSASTQNEFYQQILRLEKLQMTWFPEVGVLPKSDSFNGLDILLFKLHTTICKVLYLIPYEKMITHKKGIVRSSADFIDILV